MGDIPPVTTTSTTTHNKYFDHSDSYEEYKEYYQQHRYMNSINTNDRNKNDYDSDRNNLNGDKIPPTEKKISSSWIISPSSKSSSPPPPPSPPPSLERIIKERNDKKRIINFDRENIIMNKGISSENISNDAINNTISDGFFYYGDNDRHQQQRVFDEKEFHHSYHFRTFSQHLLPYHYRLLQQQTTESFDDACSFIGPKEEEKLLTLMKSDFPIDSQPDCTIECNQNILVASCSVGCSVCHDSRSSIGATSIGSRDSNIFCYRTKYSMSQNLLSLEGNATSTYIYTKSVSGSVGANSNGLNDGSVSTKFTTNSNNIVSNNLYLPKHGQTIVFQMRNSNACDVEYYPNESAAQKRDRSLMIKCQSCKILDDYGNKNNEAHRACSYLAFKADCSNIIPGANNVNTCTPIEKNYGIFKNVEEETTFPGIFIALDPKIGGNDQTPAFGDCATHPPSNSPEITQSPTISPKMTQSPTISTDSPAKSLSTHPSAFPSLIPSITKTPTDSNGDESAGRKGKITITMMMLLTIFQFFVTDYWL